MKRLLLLPAALLLLGMPSHELRASSDRKVLICHIPPGNPENRHEIIVDFHAVPAHVANHGDLIGSCEILIPE
jgi:hypothetical protein